MKRITYFDGLRGMACLQGVADHYAAAFYPAMVLQLRFLTCGSGAVNLFFLISGFVLTKAFAASDVPTLTLAIRRVFRLAVPAMVSVAIAGALVLLSYRAADMARLAHGWAGAPTLLCGFKKLSGFGYDMSGITILLGYKDNGFFQFHWLNGMATTINSPLWTISVEIWGSLWILLLTASRRISRYIYLAIFLISVILAGNSYLFLFAIGHVFAKQKNLFASISPAIASVFGIILIIDGAVFLSGFHSSLFAGKEDEAGAILLFSGVFIAPQAQKILDLKIPQYIGRLSFPIYLLHCPILSSAGSYIFLLSLPLGFADAALMAFAAGMTITIVAAIIFERCIDAPVISLARSLKDIRWNIRRRPVALAAD